MEESLWKRQRTSISGTYRAGDRITTQKIEVGQVIRPKDNSVEFVARIGRRTIGIEKFDYAPNTEDQEEVEETMPGDDDDPDYW